MRLLIVSMLMVFSTVSAAQCLTLSWTNATEREDGKAIEAIEAINIYHTFENVLQGVIVVGATDTEYNPCDVQEGGVHAFELTTIEDGREGGETKTYTIHVPVTPPPEPPAAPKPPNTTTVTITVTSNQPIEASN